MAEQKPITIANFQAYLAEKKLMGTRCKKCGALHLPPRAICPDCRSTDMEWTQFSGEGKLAAFTCISVTPTWMAAEGYGRNKPYCSGIVQTEEGPRICAIIYGVEAKNPESIKVGTPVNMDIMERTKGGQKTAYLAFKAKSAC